MADSLPPSAGSGGPFTPLSDAALESYPKFSAEVRARLETGRQAYRDASFERPIGQLIEELRQEALDLCGWSFIVWARMERLERLVMEVTSAHRPTEDAPRAPVYMGWDDMRVEIGSVPVNGTGPK